ncbi:MAG: manganese efflux pump [Clostridia bacterium]|nr:manganese efflux pump [Clostridia bacterium]
MELITLFCIAVGLSMDAFAVSITNGLYYKNFKKSQVLLSALTYGLFQGLMPLIGYFFGSLFFSVISRFDHWIALLLLGFIGFNMIADSIKEIKHPETITNDSEFGCKTLFLQAIATSIDALTVGISFAAMNVNILFSVTVIALVTFSFCIVGGFLGKRFGSLLKEKAKVFGGVILILIGLKIFLEHTL